MIVPRDGQVLECAEAVWFERIGHLAMTDNDEVLAKLIEVVERPLPEAHAPGHTRDSRRTQQLTSGRSPGRSEERPAN